MYLYNYKYNTSSCLKYSFFLLLQQHVETIRNFIAIFFRCDVCRHNFVEMYDGCGHDHCTRLSRKLPFIQNSNLNQDQTEMSLWLWEVHNAVNLRLLEEKAIRERRNFTKAEQLASKFPTRNTCPSCWLDEEMNDWDSAEVYNFLKGFYWPAAEQKIRSGSTTTTTIGGSKHMHGEMSIEGQPLSRVGLIYVIVPFFLMLLCMFLKQNYLNKVGLYFKKSRMNRKNN